MAYDWFGAASKFLDYGTKAVSLYGAAKGLFDSPDSPGMYSPAMPHGDPDALNNMNAAADAKAEEEKRRRLALYDNKSGTVMNQGGLGGLATTGPVGKKKTLLGAGA